MLNQKTNVKEDSIKFSVYRPTERDQKKFYPKQIMDFKLEGIFMNENKNEDDVTIYCFYVNTKNQDIMAILHNFSIGNVSTIQLYSHDIRKDYLEDKSDIVNKLLRMGTPIVETDTVKTDLMH
ncbi:hypothetical protein I6I99_11020 [Sphingobacterium multivorum]|nr:hypothetical protein [Sphingobacterium multivorum]QQT33058.1 hypothetical protein I6I99_11020 [Sphingobacterium multivorum]